MSDIEFREPVAEDVEPLIELAVLHKDIYLGDGETLDGESFALPELFRKFTLVFTSPAASGPIGAVDFTDINGDLSATLHFILNPAFLRPFLKQKTYLNALLDRFRTLNIKKFNLSVPDFNQSGIKLATKIGFQHVATFQNEIYYGGKPRDIHYYTLTRKDLANALAKQFIEEETAPVPVVKPKAYRKRTPNVQQKEIG